MKNTLECVWLLLALGACNPLNPLPPATPLDPPPTPGTAADCKAACAHLVALHCPSGDPTPQGGTCEQVCLNTEESGYASMNPRCLAQIKACADEEACTE